MLSGEWKEGDQLPTEKELSHIYDVSLITIRRAIQELVNKGMFYRIRGKGTFVTSKLREDNIFNLVTFENREETRPHKLLYSAIEMIKGSLALKLNSYQNDKVLKVIRLNLGDDEPVALEYSYLVKEFCPNASPSLGGKELIYDLIQKYCEVQLDRAKIYFSTKVSDSYEAEMLQIKEGTPLIVLERTTYTTKDRPVEYSKFIVRQDKASYYFEVQLC